MTQTCANDIKIECAFDANKKQSPLKKDKSEFCGKNRKISLCRMFRSDLKLCFCLMCCFSHGLGFANMARATDSASDLVPAVEVDAQRTSDRNVVTPDLGGSTYVLDAQAIDAVPGGQDASLRDVLLQAPGVTDDSFGQVHIREEHNGLQYRLNGIILPEGLSFFGQALSPRLAERITLITGALPAQYGLRVAGIVDVTTKAGFTNGGSAGIYGGAHQDFQPSLSYGGGKGGLNGFFSLSWKDSALGIEAPDARMTPAHDRTDQGQAFGYVEKNLDNGNKFSLILGSSLERFQIPNRLDQNPGILLGANQDQPLSVLGQTDFSSANVNETQREINHYAIGSYLRSDGLLKSQISLFARYSRLIFTPDTLADLLFNGLSQKADKLDTSLGLQIEETAKSGAHELRGGLLLQNDRATGRTLSETIGLDATGSQISDQPLVIQDSNAKTAKTFGFYLQDSWEIFKDLTLNIGARYDRFDGFRTEDQLSPRLSAVWIPLKGTALHLGYARYFSPPPFELVGSESLARFTNTTAASPVTEDTTPFAERANSYDFGLKQDLTSSIDIGFDSYYKQSRNLIDEGQFGAPIILTPFNYRDGIQYGYILSSDYHQGPLRIYANLAYGQGRGRNIVSSQFNFSAKDLAYIRNHYVYLDHVQRYTGSMGLSYKLGGMGFDTTLIYGSGLRRDGNIPNGRSGPNYTTVNLSIHKAFDTALGLWEARCDAINVFDKIYEIRDGTGIGVGAPQYGERGGLYFGLKRSL